mmetsp:Transcript_37344/g.78203  ORF Transcript_37344/g.78203 Transcript_37344/m.78203 type:complete len:158 (-) Transcript_37344:91-564(-)
MLGVLIFLTVVAAPAAGSMLSLQILHNSMIKSPRLSFSNIHLRQNVELAQVATGAASLIQPENLLRLRGGKKGTASQGKRGTGHKAHPSYKYNLSYPRKSRADGTTWKRYTLKKNPQGKGRMRHMRKVCQRFKNGFRCSSPYQGPPVSTSANPATPA